MEAKKSTSQGVKTAKVPMARETSLGISRLLKVKDASNVTDAICLDEATMKKADLLANIPRMTDSAVVTLWSVQQALLHEELVSWDFKFTLGARKVMFTVKGDNQQSDFANFGKLIDVMGVDYTSMASYRLLPRNGILTQDGYEDTTWQKDFSTTIDACDTTYKMNPYRRNSLRLHTRRDAEIATRIVLADSTLGGNRVLGYIAKNYLPVSLSGMTLIEGIGISNRMILTGYMRYEAHVIWAGTNDILKINMKNITPEQIGKKAARDWRMAREALTAPGVHGFKRALVLPNPVAEPIHMAQEEYKVEFWKTLEERNLYVRTLAEMARNDPILGVTVVWEDRKAHAQARVGPSGVPFFDTIHVSLQSVLHQLKDLEDGVYQGDEENMVLVDRPQTISTIDYLTFHRENMRPGKEIVDHILAEVGMESVLSPHHPSAYHSANLMKNSKFLAKKSGNQKEVDLYWKELQSVSDQELRDNQHLPPMNFAHPLPFLHYARQGMVTMHLQRAIQDLSANLRLEEFYDVMTVPIRTLAPGPGMLADSHFLKGLQELKPEYHLWFNEGPDVAAMADEALTDWCLLDHLSLICLIGPERYQYGPIDWMEGIAKLETEGELFAAGLLLGKRAKRVLPHPNSLPVKGYVKGTTLKYWNDRVRRHLQYREVFECVPGFVQFCAEVGVSHRWLGYGMDEREFSAAWSPRARRLGRNVSTLLEEDNPCQFSPIRICRNLPRDGVPRHVNWVRQDLRLRDRVVGGIWRHNGPCNILMREPRRFTERMTSESWAKLASEWKEDPKQKFKATLEFKFPLRMMGQHNSEYVANLEYLDPDTTPNYGYRAACETCGSMNLAFLCHTCRALYCESCSTRRHPATQLDDERHFVVPKAKIREHAKMSTEQFLRVLQANIRPEREEGRPHPKEADLSDRHLKKTPGDLWMESMDLDVVSDDEEVVDENEREARLCGLPVDPALDPAVREQGTIEVADGKDLRAFMTLTEFEYLMEFLKLNHQISRYLVAGGILKRGESPSTVLIIGARMMKIKGDARSLPELAASYQRTNRGEVWQCMLCGYFIKTRNCSCSTTSNQANLFSDQAMCKYAKQFTVKHDLQEGKALTSLVGEYYRLSTDRGLSWEKQQREIVSKLSPDSFLDAIRAGGSQYNSVDLEWWTVRFLQRGGVSKLCAGFLEKGAVGARMSGEKSRTASRQSFDAITQLAACTTSRKHARREFDRMPREVVNVKFSVPPYCQARVTPSSNLGWNTRLRKKATLESGEVKTQMENQLRRIRPLFEMTEKCTEVPIYNNGVEGAKCRRGNAVLSRCI